MMKDRIRSTHVHDNNGKDDKHLFPLLAEGGTVDWSRRHGAAQALRRTSSRCCSSCARRPS